MSNSKKEYDDSGYFIQVWRWVIDKVGQGSAIVYGVIYGYCHMRDGYCHASISEIAKKARLSTRQVHRCLNGLLEKGLIVDVTDIYDPNWKLKTPRSYEIRDRKAVIRIGKDERIDLDI